jgi:hypothetical protein
VDGCSKEPDKGLAADLTGDLHDLGCSAGREGEVGDHLMTVILQPRGRRV